jgi:hypothetical protein
MLTNGLKRLFWVQNTCDIPQIKNNHHRVIRMAVRGWDSRWLLKRMKKPQYSDLPHVQDSLFLLREIVFGQSSS